MSSARRWSSRAATNGRLETESEILRRPAAFIWSAAANGTRQRRSSRPVLPVIRAPSLRSRTGSARIPTRKSASSSPAGGAVGFRSTHPPVAPSPRRMPIPRDRGPGSAQYQSRPRRRPPSSGHEQDCTRRATRTPGTARRSKTAGAAEYPGQQGSPRERLKSAGSAVAAAAFRIGVINAPTPAGTVRALRRPPRVHRRVICSRNPEPISGT